MEGLAFIVALTALVVAIVAAGLVLRAERRPAESSIGGARSADLERHLAQLVRRMETLEDDVDAHRSTAVAGDSRPAAPRGPAAISRIGLVRFDAFEDTGGAQSFALALIDDEGDGIVLTSLHSRPTTRVYVKAIRRGVADAPLSVEETRALQDVGLTPTT